MRERGIETHSCLKSCSYFTSTRLLLRALRTRHHLRQPKNHGLHYDLQNMRTSDTSLSTGVAWDNENIVGLLSTTFCIIFVWNIFLYFEYLQINQTPCSTKSTVCISFRMVIPHLCKTPHEPVWQTSTRAEYTTSQHNCCRIYYFKLSVLWFKKMFGFW